ncbi:hypothetical protein OH77DRAFT_969187 [Trametes cingulata]|nr:hypothetical protein OH77DRAFT_969187 [Trametes cingulata]
MPSDDRTMLLYDWIIALDRERELVWSRKMNAASVLYILSRVLGPSASIASMVLFSPVSDETYVPQTVAPRIMLSLLVTFLRCNVMMDFEHVLSLLPYGIWAWFASLRTYALSSRNILLTAIIFALMTVPVAANTYMYAFSKATNYAQPLGCTDTKPFKRSILVAVQHHPRRRNRDFIDLERNGFLARTISLPKCRAGTQVCSQSSRHERNQLLRSFAAAERAVSGDRSTASEPTIIVAYFRDPITTVMISRFLLDLLEASTSDDARDEGRDVLPTDWTEDFGDLYSAAPVLGDSRISSPVQG